MGKHQQRVRSSHEPDFSDLDALLSAIAEHDVKVADCDMATTKYPENASAYREMAAQELAAKAALLEPIVAFINRRCMEKNMEFLYQGFFLRQDGKIYNDAYYPFGHTHLKTLPDVLERIGIPKRNITIYQECYTDKEGKHQKGMRIAILLDAAAINGLIDSAVRDRLDPILHQISDASHAEYDAKYALLAEAGRMIEKSTGRDLVNPRPLTEKPCGRDAGWTVQVKNDIARDIRRQVVNALLGTAPALHK